MSLVYLAAEHEDDEKVRFWLTAAAREGNVAAMRELILAHDESLEQSWVWMYLSQLLGHDLGEDHYDLVHDNGDRYDDDIGGPGHVVGDDGIELEPLSDDADAIAVEEARRLSDLIEAKQQH